MNNNININSIDNNFPYYLNADGASKSNSTKAGAGYVIYDHDMKEILCGAKFLGGQTSNTAEYSALLLGLMAAIELDIKNIHIRLDSQLVVGQVEGLNGSSPWNVTMDHLREFINVARTLLMEFDTYTLKHIPREENGRADELSNLAINPKYKKEKK
jgi:ribonuclease HI